MIKVQYLGLSPIDIDGFPKKAERSVKGALHLRPSSVYEMTADEYNFIQANFQEVKLTVQPTGGKVVKSKEK